MRQFYTANLDTSRALVGEYYTEPYEAAWASEAIFFLRIEQFEVPAVAGVERRQLEASAQISLDGVVWVDEGSSLQIDSSGDKFLRVTHFGGWLRLKTIVPDGTTVTASVYLVLKE